MYANLKKHVWQQYLIFVCIDWTIPPPPLCSVSPQNTFDRKVIQIRQLRNLPTFLAQNKHQINNISEHTFLHMLLWMLPPNPASQSPPKLFQFFGLRILGLYLHCPSQDMLVKPDMSYNFTYLHPEKGEADCSWHSPGTNQQKSFLPLRPGRFLRTQQWHRSL